MHLIITMVYTPLVRRLPSSTRSLTSFRVAYEDGQGILRDVLSVTTDLGYVVANLEVERIDGEANMVAVSRDAGQMPTASASGLAAPSRRCP